MGGYIGVIYAIIIGVIKGDTRSLGYSTHGKSQFGFWGDLDFKVGGFGV